MLVIINYDISCGFLVNINFNFIRKVRYFMQDYSQYDFILVVVIINYVISFSVFSQFKLYL